MLIKRLSLYIIILQNKKLLLFIIKIKKDLYIGNMYIISHIIKYHIINLMVHLLISNNSNI